MSLETRSLGVVRDLRSLRFARDDRGCDRSLTAPKIIQKWCGLETDLTLQKKQLKTQKARKYF